MADAQRSGVIQNDSSQLDAFKDLTRRLLGVPKREVDKQRVEEKKKAGKAEKERA